MLFEPKPREQILQDLATSKYSNREFLIEYYNEHPETFDKLFDLICKAPIISLNNMSRGFRNTNKYGPLNYDTAVIAIKIFKLLNWFPGKTFIIESKKMMDGYEIFYLVQESTAKKKE